MNQPALHKNELARKAGVTPRTFRKWLKNPLVIEKLKATGYYERQKILTPKQVHILCIHFIIID